MECIQSCILHTREIPHQEYKLKAIIKNIAKEKNISAQLVMQNFMLERLLERVSVSKYQDSFILKGRLLSRYIRSNSE